jgi:uracil-DNA glycosylase family 4
VVSDAAAIGAARATLERARLLGERRLYRLRRAESQELHRGQEPGPAAEPHPTLEPPAAVADGFDEAAWRAIEAEALKCTRCDLCSTRTKVVWGSGTPRTGVMVVGEAPGYHEDQQGEAFVGRAGQLLTKILEAIGFGRDEVFITNVLKCRPPGNADPQPHQVAECERYLIRQIELIDPAVILTLGRHAARTLLRDDGSMASLRGRIHRYEGVPLVATYHPAALLRNPALKRPTWEDVQLLKKVYDEAMAARSTQDG